MEQELSVIGAAAPLVDATQPTTALASSPTLQEPLSEQPIQIQTDVLESEPALETERQRRLGSFELLDAAMDDVVDHDATDDVDEHVIPDISATASRIADADSDRPLLADAHIAVSDTQAIECDPVDNDNDDATSTEAMQESVDPSELLHTDAAPEAVTAHDDSAAVATTASCSTEAISDDAAVPPPHTESSLAHAATSASPSNRFEQYEPELLEWLQACQAADHGTNVSCRSSSASNTRPD